MKSFNFGEALSFMEIGETVCLELDGKTRLYRLLLIGMSNSSNTHS